MIDLLGLDLEGQLFILYHPLFVKAIRRREDHLGLHSFGAIGLASDGYADLPLCG